jgi:quercetin dioxygenase-like cupin family protein
MQGFTIPVIPTGKKTDRTAKNGNRLSFLWYLFYPVGLFKIWKIRRKLLLKILYSILYLPVFLIVFFYVAIVLFASFLKPLDKTVGVRSDRTIVNSAGNYAATFIKTGADTHGDYELVQVELEPKGGNDWHYHKDFEEQFTVLDGSVKIGRNGNEILLKKGETTMANREEMHFFKNARDEKSVLLVKVSPAAGLEKTLRVAYGLINDGLLENDMTKNPWHMALLLGYSESYLEGLPSWFQEPLINSLARIAQWKGEDKDLYRYFK